MALVQVGMGVGRVVLITGAWLDPSLSATAALAELQEALGDKDAGGSGSGSTITDALTESVKQMASEVRKMGSEATVVYVVDAAGKGVASSLVAPAAAAGALGYGYMRWKGISISSVMYGTKKNMANAVASMTKHLEQVQSSLAAAKRHLTQRIQHLDDKLDQQKEISGQIRDEVTGARMKLQDIGSEMQKIKEVARAWSEQNGGKLPHSVEHLQRTARLSGFTGDQKQLQGLGQLLAIESGTTLGGVHCNSARLFNGAA